MELTDLRRERRERRRVAYRRPVASFALAATIALVAVACDGGDAETGTSSNEAVPTVGSTTMGPVSSSFLEPQADEVTLFEVEADDAEFWRPGSLIASTASRGASTWTDPMVACPCRLRRACHGPMRVRLSKARPWSRPSTSSVTSTSRTRSLWRRRLRDHRTDRGLHVGSCASQAHIDGGLDAGTEYTVRSRIVVPTPEELDQVDHLAPRAYGRWTELPADLDPRIERIAERWTADATSDYRKVLAIQEHFQNGRFVYSTDIDPGVDLLEFLRQTRTGFCVQYSSAMAVMVRALGIPARVGYGFRAGTRQEDGSYLVTTGDAHFWVEVLFPGYGWLQFEPEAGTDHPNARAGTYLNPVPTDAS
jgi:hypothetical protein